MSDTDRVGKEKIIPCTCPHVTCQNHGKCRECVSAHKAFHSAPLCILLMEADIKKNHIHKINPHIKTPLSLRIAAFFQENPQAAVEEAASSLKVTPWQILDGWDRAVPVPKEEWRRVYHDFAFAKGAVWEYGTGAVRLQLSAEFLQENGTADNTPGDAVFGKICAELHWENLYQIFLIRKEERQGYRLVLVNEEERIALEVCLGDFAGIQSGKLEKLWERYKKAAEDANGEGR